jgi:hypothetical protein
MRVGTLMADKSTCRDFSCGRIKHEHKPIVLPSMYVGLHARIDTKTRPIPTGCNPEVSLSEMEGTGPELGKVVIRKSVLSPLPIGGFSIEPDIRMNRHAVKSKHSSVDSMSNFWCDGLGCHRVEEQMPGLEDQGHSRAKVSASPVSIGWRAANDKHLTGLK